MSKIAPHEGREIDLVIAGTKPLAVIEQRKDPDQYDRAMAMKIDEFSPVFITPMIGPEGPEAVIYTLFGDFHKYRDAMAMPEGNAKTRALGLVFGYSEAEVEEFIANPPQCDCSKCSGCPQRRAGDARRTQFHAK